MVYHVQFPGLGLSFTINRVALSIGGFNIYWYGVIIAVACCWRCCMRSATLRLRH